MSETTRCSFRVHRVASAFPDAHSIDFWISSDGRVHGHSRCHFDNRGFLPFEVAISPDEFAQLQHHFFHATSNPSSPALTVGFGLYGQPRQFKSFGIPAQTAAEDGSGAFFQQLEAICQEAIRIADQYVPSEDIDD